MVEPAGEDEEIVTETVDVAHHHGVDVCSGVGEVEDFALGTATYCAGYVGHAGCYGPAGEYERALGRHGGIEAVDGVLEGFDVGLGDSRLLEVGGEWIVRPKLRRGVAR